MFGLGRGAAVPCLMMMSLWSSATSQQVEGRHLAGLLTLTLGLKCCTFCDASPQNHNCDLFLILPRTICIYPFMFRIVWIVLEIDLFINLSN